MRRNVVNAYQLRVNLGTKRRREAPNGVLRRKGELWQHLWHTRSRMWDDGQLGIGFEYDVKGPKDSMLRIEVTEFGVRY